MHDIQLTIFTAGDFGENFQISRVVKILFIPNCTRQIIWLLILITYKWQFLSRFSILRDKWRVWLLQLYWMKIWHVNSSVRFIHSLQVMYKNWALSLLLVKSSLHSHLNSRTGTENKRKLPRGFEAAFFKSVFRVVKKTMPCSRLSSQRNSSTSTSWSNQNAEKRS